MDPVRKAPLCVLCRRHPGQDPWRPFCSERCKLLDLANWADGAYRVPATGTDARDDEFRPEDSEFSSDTED